MSKAPSSLGDCTPATASVTVSPLPLPSQPQQSQECLQAQQALQQPQQPRFIDRPPPQYPSLASDPRITDGSGTAAVDPMDLRVTVSSGEYSTSLTKERLDRHQEQYRDIGIVDGHREGDQDNNNHGVEENGSGGHRPRRGMGYTAHGENNGEGEEEIMETVQVTPSRSLRERMWRSLEKIRGPLVLMRARMKEMTWKQLLKIAILVGLVMAGNAMQILMLNFWLVSFPADGTPGNYTAFAVPGILFSLFFAITLAVYIVVKRPGLRFARSWYGWGLLIGVGFCDTFNSWLATYAASYTSEVLQALFTNLCPLYAVFMSKWILHDPRKYVNGWIISVFILTIAGILVASLYGLIKANHVKEGNVWIFIFFLSIPFRVLQNVWQSLYMIVYTRDPAFTEWLGRRFWHAANASSTGGDDCGCGSAGEGASGGNRDGASGRGGVKSRGKARGGVDGALDYTSVVEPTRLSDGMLADDTMLRDGDSELGTARLLIAPPTSACPSEPPESTGNRGERERFLSANVSFGYRQTDPASSVHTHGDAAGVGDSGGGHNSAGHAPLQQPPSHQQQLSTHSLPPSSAAAAAAMQSLPQEIVSIRYHQGEDMIVKLVMLAGETVAQTCFTLALLPADALPWWGNSSSVQETWDNFIEGIICVFTIRNNFIFGFLYTLGFVFTYCGCAYLNHYSVALCSIVTQLSSPLTALLLVLVPSWNVQEGGDSPWYLSLIAIVFLSIAALVYVMWEEMTDAEKVEGERLLKMRKLRVRPLESDSAFPSEPTPLS